MSKALAGLWRWAGRNAADLLAAGSLLAVGAGFWMAWRPLGLIVPGAIVFGCLAWGRLRGG